MTVLPVLLAGLAAALALGVRLPAAAPSPCWSVPAAAAAAALLLGPVAAVAALLLGVGGIRAWERRAAARAAADERAGAVEALSVLASELRAGRAPDEALLVAGGVATGPFAHAVAGAGRAVRMGGDPVRVLRAAEEGSGAAPALRGLAACLQVSAGSGASLAAATDAVAESLRNEQEQRLEVEAEVAGPRATAVMLALLPVAGTLLSAGLGARPAHVLLHTAVGAGCLLLGLLLDLAGLWWTERLVLAALR